MLILAFESSAKSASAALCRDGELLAQSYQNCGLTHSRTLLPMAEALLKNTGFSLPEVDLFAIAHGPGSFTGIRIGVSAVKGLAWALEKSICGVSTLEAMAWHGLAAPEGSVICPVMDARRNEVYNALFEMRDGKPHRLCGDRAIPIETLRTEISENRSRAYWLVGDGALLCFGLLRESQPNVRIAPAFIRNQSAWGVAMAAQYSQAVSPHELLPVYLRLSQAERERLEKITDLYKVGYSMSNVYIMDHPLILHKLSIIRDKSTSVKEFRELVSEISMLMCYDATRDLPTEVISIETPVATATVKRLSGKKLAVAPILRAGLGMVDGILHLIPSAKVGHIGLFRDPETLNPVEYYCKMPGDISEREVIILDPMLATGGSATAAAKVIKDLGCKSVKLMCIIAAPEGIRRMQDDHPDVDIYVAQVDECLNSHGYIVPGLGDAGDRIFGTK